MWRAISLCNFSHRLNHGNDGNYGFFRTSRFVAVADDLDRREGPYTIVYTHYAFCVVRNQSQSVLYAVEARLAAISQLVIDSEIVFFTELSPIVLLSLGQDQNDLQGGGVLAEAFQRPHQYRLSAYGQKLLGNVASHAKPLPTGYNDDIVHQAIRCLKRIPSAIWSAVCLLTNCASSS